MIIEYHCSLAVPYPPVKVGVAVLIENTRTNRVLITRRSPTMYVTRCPLDLLSIILGGPFQVCGWSQEVQSMNTHIW